ncbi:hypothetical protein RB594_003441 [Gaeumannomyces avenae]
MYLIDQRDKHRTLPFTQALLFKMLLNSLLALAIPALAAPAPMSPNEPSVLVKRDTCANYRFMSMGQLHFYNGATISAELQYSYDQSSWTKINPSGNILSGQSRDFYRDNELKTILRDTNFYIRVCDTLINRDCGTSPGVFQIPSAGKQQWVASVEAEDQWRWPPKIYTEVLCEIGSQLPNSSGN